MVAISFSKHQKFAFLPRKIVVAALMGAWFKAAFVMPK